MQKDSEPASLSKIPSDTNRPAGDGPGGRRDAGIVLVIVLWVLLILTVVAWTLARQTQMEIRMTGFQLDSARAYYLARAGVTRAMVFLREDKLKDMGVLGQDDLIELEDKDVNWVYDAYAEAWGYNPDAYGVDPEEDESDWGATLEGGRGKLKVEMVDLSGRLNINTPTVGAIGTLIKQIGVDGPYAWPLALAIVDYIDQDDVPGVWDQEVSPLWEFGDQSSEEYYYNPHLSPQEVDYFGGDFVMKNAPLDAIEELLLIPGMTEGIFYGEDRNMNRILDENEDDGEETLPFDNADGFLQLGLRDLTSVYSGLAGDRIGRPNINTALYEVILASFFTEGMDEAQMEREVEKILDYRSGNDGALGTDDDNRFRTLPHTDENRDGIDQVGLNPDTEAMVAERFGTASDYFQIVSTGEVNNVKKTLRVTVFRIFQQGDVVDQTSSASIFNEDERPEEEVKLMVIDFEELG